MMKEEFARLTDKEFTDEQYKIIEFVYMYHPAIENKQDIANIFNLKNGYTIIKSMVDDSSKAQAIEAKIFSINSKINELNRQKEELQKELKNL